MPWEAATSAVLTAVYAQVGEPGRTSGAAEARCGRPDSLPARAGPPLAAGVLPTLLKNLYVSVKAISAHRKEKAKPAEKRIIVKNTFLHIETVKTIMPRSNSMPQLQVP